MLLFSLLFAQAVSARSCSIDQILVNPKDQAACVKHFTKQIKNEQDRAEFKYRIGRWKPNKDLHVIVGEGFVEAQIKGETKFRAIWLQMSNPAVLWIDGHILTDKSNNPSIARTIDNLFKSKPTASLDFLPKAYAQAAGKDLERELLFFYRLESGGQDLEKFLPVPHWMVRKFSDSKKEVKCKTQQATESDEFYFDGGGQTRGLTITPRSPTEFIVTGIENKKTHLIKLETSKDKRERSPDLSPLHPALTVPSSKISLCSDDQCALTSNTMPLQERDFIFFMKSPEEAAAHSKGLSESERENFGKLNKGIRYSLASKLFSMSVLSACCGNTLCQDLLKKRFAIDVQPPPPVQESKARN